MGSTIGIIGTMDSTTSVVFVEDWFDASDMLDLLERS
jgi:hypothetical protein